MQMTAANTDRLGDASYSPEDNKLRMRPFARLSAEDYARFKAAGFSWAPRQELFVAPMWTPERADLLQETCGEIDDEDTSLVERAEERADRFEEYSDKRKDDADRAHKAVAAIADNIPLGQPILVGHHSEKHARKDAQRIENGMRKAVKMWEKSQYWISRAKGALAHAKYKELPAVRFRRIKGLEADKRKFEKNIKESTIYLKLWRREGLTQDQALSIANHDGAAFGLWSELKDGKTDAASAATRAISRHESRIASNERWLAHTDNRIAYERAMLDEDGGTAADKFPVEVGGRVLVGREWHVVTKVNRANGRINSVSVFGSYVRGIEDVTDYKPPADGDAEKVKAVKKLAPLVNYPGEEFRHMLKAEYESRAKHSDMWSVRKIAASDKYGAHRRREATPEKGNYWNTVGVYLTDCKRTDPPAVASEAPDTSGLGRVSVPREPRPVEVKTDDGEPFAAMKDALKAGVKVAVVEQLFVTPPDLAATIAKRADVFGRIVLEPSAGMGALALACRERGAKAIVCIDNARACVERLRALNFRTVVEGDFLELPPLDDDEKHERIVMNPPFADSADVRHVTHAWEHWLAPGGRLVAIMSAGVKVRSDKAHVAFRALVEANGEIEDLPVDSFKASGTGVATVLVTLTKG